MTEERKNKTIDFRVTIRKLMIKKGDISVAKLARHPDVDLHSNTLYNYLNNNSNMLAKNIEKILDTLNGM